MVENFEGNSVGQFENLYHYLALGVSLYSWSEFKLQLSRRVPFFHLSCSIHNGFFQYQDSCTLSILGNFYSWFLQIFLTQHSSTVSFGNLNREMLGLLDLCMPPKFSFMVFLFCFSFYLSQTTDIADLLAYLFIL